MVGGLALRSFRMLFSEFCLKMIFCLFLDACGVNCMVLNYLGSMLGLGFLCPGFF